MFSPFALGLQPRGSGPCSRSGLDACFKSPDQVGRVSCLPIIGPLLDRPYKSKLAMTFAQINKAFDIRTL